MALSRSVAVLAFSVAKTAEAVFGSDKMLLGVELFTLLVTFHPKISTHAIEAEIATAWQYFRARAYTISQKAIRFMF